jgi:hypothetical protein
MKLIEEIIVTPEPVPGIFFIIAILAVVLGIASFLGGRVEGVVAVGMLTLFVGAVTLIILISVSNHKDYQYKAEIEDYKFLVDSEFQLVEVVEEHEDAPDIIIVEKD